ncbi:acetyl esterase [Paraburkholderia bannensis]|uniref:Acetyl esterase n=1 Tax=Paraburkholderia bannensis TaxID=765414 RepID=A0A7W9WWZ5_9BURK|nr:MULTISPECIES: alpha/beta hydrolase [Paraburkholderia]MBB3261717.1 acetyl esterase [Paraburkholderia sp. WP4_3_2]MBB6106663.1 acetyl esterase [Paraburkholderia bannensis]
MKKLVSLMAVGSALIAGSLSGAASAQTVPQLEPTTQAFIDKLTAAGGPPLYEMTPHAARKVLDDIQADPNGKLAPAQEKEVTLPVGPTGKTEVRVIRPADVKGTTPVIMYFHGGGWILGNAATHDRLVRDLANRAHATIVFVEYEPSPEAQFPVAIEQDYAATKYVAEHPKEFDVDASRLAIAGDSVGGNMVAVVAQMAKERHGPAIRFQAMFYPVTDYTVDDSTYEDFPNGPWLTKKAMQWFWHAYLPNATETQANDPHVSPLRASLDALKDLPPALVITDENDVLRHEGEAYAHKLAQAGVNVTAVRFLGTQHDFMMLNPLRDTPAALGATALAGSMLNQALAK